MNAKQLVRMMINETGVNAKAMSLTMGRSQNYVTKSVSAPGVTFATVQAIAEAYGYELTVVRKKSGRRSESVMEARK